MNLGEKQELTAVKKVEFGMYLAENPEDETRVLLPAKQVPEGLCIGDKVEIFLYRDSKDRLIATTHEPKLVLGQLAVLPVLPRLEKSVRSWTGDWKRIYSFLIRR